jgi:hypothetical protein
MPERCQLDVDLVDQLLLRSGRFDHAEMLDARSSAATVLWNALMPSPEKSGEGIAGD